MRFKKGTLSEESSLAIIAYDDDVVSDDLIGSMETTIGELLKNNTAQLEYPPGEAFGGDFAGEISMDCKFDEGTQEYVFRVIKTSHLRDVRKVTDLRFYTDYTMIAYSAILFALYYIIGVLFYSLVPGALNSLTGTDYVCNGSKLVEVTTTIEDNFKWEKIFDAFYFATYTWTTVGYGDMGPTTAGCRLFTVFYSLFAIMAAAPSLGLIMSYFQEHRSENDVAKHNKPKKKKCGCCKCWLDFKENNAIFYEVTILALRLLAIIVVGALIYAMDYYSWETADRDTKHFPIDFLYYSVITTTTVGFGDDAPQSPYGRILGAVYLVFAVNEFMNTLTQLAELPQAIRQAQEENDVLSQFGKDLSASELRSVILLSCADPNSTRCSKEEFILGMLIRQNKLNFEDVETVGAQFDGYDLDRSGNLDVRDIKVPTDT